MSKNLINSLIIFLRAIWVQISAMEDAWIEFNIVLDEAENEDDEEKGDRRRVVLPSAEAPSVIGVHAITYSTCSSKTDSGSSAVISALTAGISSSKTVTTNSSSSSVCTNNRPSSTVRNKPKVNKIKKGSRVKRTRSKFYQVLNSDRQRESISPELPNSALFYRVVTKGSSEKG